MWCPNCKAEYVQGIFNCPECEIPLVDRLVEESRQPATPIEFEEILTTHDHGMIAIIKSMLDGEEITYIFHGDSTTHIHPAIPARLMVKKDQVANARELLRDFIESKDYEHNDKRNSP